MKDRIQKLLAEAGVESRRHVEEMVLQGRVAVNGEVVTKLPVMIDPEEDTVEVDGERVQLARRINKERVYVLMNKPKGVYCTNVAQGEQKRAIDLLPHDFNYRVYPVGRLDADSRGLLLLTNDGELTQQLTHPRFGVVKTYTAVVDGFVKPETIERLAGGVWLADPSKGGFRTSKSFIKVVKRSGKNSVLQITIKEGRNRQVRRMLAKVGHKVRELTRVKIGTLEVGRLKPGEFRLLSPREVSELRKSIAEKRERAEAKARENPKPARAPAPKGEPRRPRGGRRGDPKKR
jgi:23S rRNA pseudouridine2605 synthase